MLYGTAGTMKTNSMTSTAAIPSTPVVLRRSFILTSARYGASTDCRRACQGHASRQAQSLFTSLLRMFCCLLSTVFAYSHVAVTCGTGLFDCVASGVYGTTPPQYDTEPYGMEVSLKPVTVRIKVELEPSSFCAVAHKVRPPVFKAESVTDLV